MGNEDVHGQFRLRLKLTKLTVTILSVQESGECDYSAEPTSIYYIYELLRPMLTMTKLTTLHPKHAKSPGREGE